MKKRRILLIPVLILLLLFSVFSIWSITAYKPMYEAVDALKTDFKVRVEYKKDIVFIPLENKKDTGFIIYPGGRVKAEAYSVAAREIAEDGYTVVIARMPFNLAVFGQSRAYDIIKKHGDIKNWGIGGHSLGGVMAASYCYKHPDKIKGLALWASYPTGGTNLQEKDIRVLSAYATNDGFVKKETIEKSKALLPLNTSYLEIKGGNHSQFGYYGFQKGDMEAAISRESQLNEFVGGTLQMLRDIDER